MTSSDDDYGQATANNAGNRRMNSNSNHPYPSASGIEVRLLMTSRDAGAVIGKGGLSIQKLRADHSRIIIQVPDCASPERVLILSGEEEQCFDALYQIIPCLTDSSRLSAFSRRRNPTAGGSTEQVQSNNGNADEPSASEIRVLIHQIYCGAIIGKGGQHVKDLRQTHNLDIKVFSQCCPLSHERVISLHGKPDDIIECLRSIYNVMATSSQQPRGSPLIQYDPHNFDVYAVNEYGGFPSTGGAENRTAYNTRGGYTATTAPPPPPPPQRGGLGARFNNNAAITSTRVTLPNELVGAIIGPRGAKIQQIRQTTNANIVIDDQAIASGNGGGGDRIITIEGTPEQISRAQALLQQAVRQSGLWRPEF